MIFVGALQWLRGHCLDCETQTGGSFTLARRGTRGSFYFNVKYLAAFANHDRAVSLRRDDRCNNFAGGLRHRIELSVPTASGAIIGANPERAGCVGLQSEHATRRQTIRVDRIRAPAIVTRQATIRCKPRHPKFCLRDGMRAIRRQTMKRGYRTPLMQIRRRRGRR
jgi:hypothetical protein